MNLQLFCLKSSTSFKIIATVIVILLQCQLQFSRGHPNGAPERICDTMMPNHGEKSLDNKHPFSITLDKWFIRGMGKIRIKIESTDSKRYSLAGLLVIIKRKNDKLRAYGSFDPKPSDDRLKTIDCFGKVGSRSGLTHSGPTPKTSLSFQWIAPNDTSAEYELHATLVRDFNSYWADYIHPKAIRVSVNATSSSSPRTSMISSIFILVLLAVVSYFGSFI